MSEELGLRERKKLERRRSIEVAALNRFGENGFDATTIDEIAADADIAPRTFFSYFPTKEDVVLADYADRLKRTTDELGRRPASEAPWLALRESFAVVAADYEAQRDDLIRRFAIMAVNPSVHARSLQLQAGWEDTVAEVLAQRMGVNAEDIRPRLMSSAALACMRSSLRHWILTGHRRSLPDLVEASFDRLGTGLSAAG
ncbi:TetR family transcriptional regulator [Candidatus Neomicrothrix sp.]|uniref:acyl-CoA-like ligand-binding transcription factor n=1 Tax=Candidatus Neomicrothrix sp. TaxID=2719034 RepID=UPI00257B2C86|nr:TetR family transcriptional regulator [Candidatus Microthrix sp.]MBK9560590.1 TetR family transcriptional regulator [Candidatus Microthrix sp.]HMS49583.1 TetR family transcriptional regulator [Candidatus Microthrix sp.]